MLPLLLLFLQSVLLIWINCFDSYLALFSFCDPSFSSAPFSHSTPSTSTALSTAFTPSSTYFTTSSTLYSSPFVTPFALSLVAVLLPACLFYSFSYHSRQAAVAPVASLISFSSYHSPLLLLLYYCMCYSSPLFTLQLSPLLSLLLLLLLPHLLAKPVAPSLSPHLLLLLPFPTSPHPLQHLSCVNTKHI